MKAPVLSTGSGAVCGEAFDGVGRFLGIPYAAPPVGALRWRPPQPYRASADLIDGSRFAAAAPQLGKGGGLIDRFFRPIRGESSEDCLYLNVWMPLDGVPNRESSGGRAVFVWIHGGGFTLGAGSTFLYDGHRIAATTGAVVVTINYRLGALGFLDLQSVDPRAEPTANLGLLDQIAAVEWVRENSQALDVDKKRITIVGESAGAMSMGCLLAVKPDLAPRWILQSGAADHVSDHGRAREVATAFLSAAGRPATDLAGLQSLPVEEVLRAQRTASLQTVTWDGTLPWQPSVDGRVLEKRPLDRIRDFAGEPREEAPAVILGTNRDEWRLFASPGLHLRLQTDTVLLRRIGRRLNLDAAAARELLGLYSTRSDGTRRSGFDIWSAVRTDQFFWAPAIALAESLEASGSPVHCYRFDLGIPSLRKGLGACHGAEIPLLFGTYSHRLLRPLYGTGELLEEVGRDLRTRWAAFAETGVPGVPGAPGAWPLYRDHRRTLVLSDETRVLDDPEPQRRRWWRHWRAAQESQREPSS